MRKISRCQQIIVKVADWRPHPIKKLSVSPTHHHTFHITDTISLIEHSLTHFFLWTEQKCPPKAEKKKQSSLSIFYAWFKKCS